MSQRYCAGCYGKTDYPLLRLCSPNCRVGISTKHWNGRVRATNENPPVLGATPSHADIPTPHPSQPSVVNPPGPGLSRGARRRFRRAKKDFPGRRGSTCSIPLPDESPPPKTARDYLRNGGDFSATSFARSVGSATSFTRSVRPLAEERVQAPVESSASGVHLPVQLSPAEQQERFRRITNARTSEIQDVVLRARQDQAVRRSSGYETDWANLVPTSPWGSSSTSGSVVSSNDSILLYHTGRAFPNSPTWTTNSWGLPPRTPTGPRAGGRADVAALERIWGVAPTPDRVAEIDDWNTDSILLSTVPDHSNLKETADHAARLLDAFANGRTPPVAGSLTTTQRGLLSAVRTSVLAITHDHLIDAAAQTDPLPPPPVPVDLTMRPDSTCMVCFSRLVDTVLMPCWHLVLCGVRIGVVVSVEPADGGIG